MPMRILILLFLSGTIWAQSPLSSDDLKALLQEHAEALEVLFGDVPAERARGAIDAALVAAVRAVDPGATVDFDGTADDGAETETGVTRESYGLLLRVHRLESGVAETIENALASTPERLVLDLRAAGGDDVEECVEVGSLLLPKKTGIGWSGRFRLETREGAMRRKSQIVVLHDEKTNGTAALLAAALGRDSNIVSIGKPIPLPLRSRRPLKLSSRTTAWIGVATLQPGLPAGTASVAPDWTADLVTPDSVRDALSVADMLTYEPKKGDRVFAIEELEWSQFSGAHILGYIGTVEEKEGSKPGTRVRLDTRYKFRYRPDEPEGVNSEEWWPDKPVRYAYSRVEFDDWEGKHSSGDSVLIPGKRVLAASAEALEEVMKPLLRFVEVTGALPGD